MDAKTLQQFEAELVNEFFAMLNQQAQTMPPQLPAPTEQTRPYYAGPSQRLIERQQIEDQLRGLVEASAARIYEMLVQRLDAMKAEQQAAIEAEQKRRAEEQRWIIEARQAARNSPPCTPSRNTWY